MNQWSRSPLGDIAESVTYGVTASANTNAVGPKFLRITDIQDNGVNWDNVPWCECSARELAESQLKCGDIVFARTGATTGKSFLIGDCPSEAVFASYLIRVRLPQNVEPRYVSQFFQTADYWTQISKGARGAAQPGVNSTTLKALEIPLPPLAEQRRIAAILDQTDALRAKRREALAHLDTLTQSIFIKMFGDPVAIGKTLAFHALDSLLDEPFQNGVYFPKEAYCQSGGVEMVHMSDAFGGIVVRGKLKRVTCDMVDQQKYSLSSDDILIARRSITYEGAAQPCMVPTSSEPLIFESSFIRVRPNTQLVTPRYLFHYLNHERVRQQYVRPYVTQSTISGINQSNLSKVPVLLPALDQQVRFGHRVALIEEMKSTQRRSLSELDALFASLQHRAFRGEL